MNSKTVRIKINKLSTYQVRVMLDRWLESDHEIPTQPWLSRLLRYRSATCLICGGRGATPIFKSVGRRCICSMCCDALEREALIYKIVIKSKRDRRNRCYTTLWMFQKALETKNIFVKDRGIRRHLATFIS